MVLFIPARKGTLIKNLKRKEALYARLTEEIKTILGERLIAIVDDVGTSETVTDKRNGKAAWSRIKRIMEKRGYRLGKNITAEAYREAQFTCVTAIAQNLHEAGNLKDQVVIRPEFTDYIVEGGTYYRESSLLYEESTYHDGWFGEIDKRKREEGNDFSLNSAVRIKFK